MTISNLFLIPTSKMNLYTLDFIYNNLLFFDLNLSLKKNLRLWDFPSMANCFYDIISCHSSVFFIECFLFHKPIFPIKQERILLTGFSACGESPLRHYDMILYRRSAFLRSVFSFIEELSYEAKKKACPYRQAFSMIAILFIFLS